MANSPDIAIDLSRLAREMEVQMYRFDFHEIDGACIRVEGRVYVGIDSALSETQSRVVAAHELAHITDDTIGLPFYSHLAERRADRMARTTLIPEYRLRSCIADGHETYDTLAALFGVPVETMVERCRELGFSS